MSKGDRSYTQEGFNKARYFMGVTVLQTSLEDKTPQEIYELYKKRWTIETYYNYIKNKADYASLHEEDYYKTQGLAFIMLISSLIYREMYEISRSIEGMTLQSCLLEARMVKVNKRHGTWTVCNCLKKQATSFGQFNTPLTVEV